jgi:hypothetical protein
MKIPPIPGRIAGIELLHKISHMLRFIVINLASIFLLISITYFVYEKIETNHSSNLTLPPDLKKTGLKLPGYSGPQSKDLQTEQSIKTTRESKYKRKKTSILHSSPQVVSSWFKTHSDSFIDS